MIDTEAEPGWSGNAQRRESSPNDKTSDARKDICRLKWNWLFVCLVVIIRALNHSCPLPTKHQFIINPTAENLNVTGKKIQPGLQQSETFYSLTYSMFYLGLVITALISGYLSNKIPMWHLFMGTILLHIVGYTLYALSTTGWMMLLSRILAGISMGAVISLSFAYFGYSSQKYADNLKVLGEYDAKRVARVKGYVFSFFNIGTGAGYIFGALFPILLSQFDVDQFRPPGWFCAGIGVLLLLLQLVVFRGECTCSYGREKGSGTSLGQIWKMLRKGDKTRYQLICTVIIPLYIILVGGVKGARYVIPDMLLSPILSDTFGFSEEYIAYFFLSVLGSIIGTIIVLIIQSLGFHGYFLSVVGGVLTMIGLLIMTDWQAIPYDHCTELSIFHNPQLVDQYKWKLLMTNDSTEVKSVKTSTEYACQLGLDYIALYYFPNYESSDKDVTCFPVTKCPVCENTTQNCIKKVLFGFFNDVRTASQRVILCNSLSASGSTVSSCFITHLERATTSLLTEVHLQSLKVVSDRVYELAVDECESTDHCNWIPNSRVTHHYCSDCQPICRNADRTLSFVQFTVGLTVLMCTMDVMYIGVFLLLSDSVSKSFQGICAGALVASIGTARSTAPLWLDFAYEGAGKQTYLPMLLLVGLIFPLWLGLLILYPWLGGKNSRAHLSHVDKCSDDNDEHKRLIPKSIDSN